MKYLILFAVFIATLECTAYCDKGITASGEYVRDGLKLDFCVWDGVVKKITTLYFFYWIFII